jgi:hypothetical protein
MKVSVNQSLAAAPIQALRLINWASNTERAGAGMLHRRVRSPGRFLGAETPGDLLWF